MPGFFIALSMRFCVQRATFSGSKPSNSSRIVSRLRRMVIQRQPGLMAVELEFLPQRAAVALGHAPFLRRDSRDRARRAPAPSHREYRRVSSSLCFLASASAASSPASQCGLSNVTAAPFAVIASPLACASASRSIRTRARPRPPEIDVSIPISKSFARMGEGAGVSAARWPSASAAAPCRAASCARRLPGRQSSPSWKSTPPIEVHVDVGGEDVFGRRSRRPVRADPRGDAGRVIGGRIACCAALRAAMLRRGADAARGSASLRRTRQRQGPVVPGSQRRRAASSG